MTAGAVTGAEYGPVEIYLLGLPDEVPDPSALSALLDLAESGVIRLLDLLLVTRAHDGDVTVVEFEELPDGFTLDAFALDAVGIVGHDDVAELAGAIPSGAAALLVAVELVYQRELAAKTAASGATLLGYERIPAPIVNALVDSLDAAQALDPAQELDLAKSLAPTQEG